MDWNTANLYQSCLHIFKLRAARRLVSTVRLSTVVTTAAMLPALLVISALLAAQLQAAPQLPPGIHPAVCPNYPFCGPAPAGAPPAPSAVSCSGELVSSYPQHFSIRFYEMVCRRWRRTRRPRRRCARSRQPGRDWSGPPVTSGPRARWGPLATSVPQASADLPDALLSDIFRNKNIYFVLRLRQEQWST